MPSTIPELPDDLLTEFLLRLPARSLARFRCVCPSWNAEITSGSFQEQHLLRASKAARLALIPRAPRSCITRLRCFDCSRVIGTKPCRGVFLAENCEGAYSVCNPSTGGVMHLPLLEGRHPRFNSAGIGFDSQSGEYKVVNLMVDSRWGSQCHVLTVGAAGSGIWRPPAAAIDHHQVSMIKDDDGAVAGIFVDGDVDPVIADGRLHWMCRTSFRLYNEPHVILSFSLADECFHQLPQPLFSASDVDVPIVGVFRNISRVRIKLIGEITSGGEQKFVVMPAGRALVELDGSLCIVRDVRRRNDVNNRLLEIWKLQDHEAGTWSMDYNISLAEEVARQQLTRPWLVVLPVCYLGSEEATQQAGSRKLVLVTTAHKACIYDPATNTLETVQPVHGTIPADADQRTSLPPLSDYVRYLLYQESIVQFVGMEHGRGSVIDELQVVPLSLS